MRQGGGNGGGVVQDEPETLAPERGGYLRQAVEAVVGEHPDSGVEILPGKWVIEVKPERFTKGTGIRHLMRDPPFRGGKIR